MSLSSIPAYRSQCVGQIRAAVSDGESCLCVSVCHRWKRDDKQEKIKDQVTYLPVLQFVAIQRRDTKEWAIPGVSSIRLCLSTQCCRTTQLLLPVLKH